jgi:hypothetical protein
MLEVGVESEKSFPHKEITEAIIGSAFEVHAQLGYGFLERVYHRSESVAICVYLWLKGN